MASTCQPKDPDRNYPVSTEGAEAPRWQGARRADTCGIQPTSNAASADESAAECKGNFDRGPNSILGVDPGSRITGFAVLEQRGRQLTVIHSGVIALDTGAPLSDRLGELQVRLEQVLDRAPPQAVAVEDVFTAQNARSALLLGQARGAVLATMGRRRLPVAAYAPALIKRAVAGHGRATKEQIQRMVQVLLGLTGLPRTDEADAMAVAICHAMTSRCQRVERPVARGARRSGGNR